MISWRRIHLWGVRNPKAYYITPPSVWAVFIYAVSLLPVHEIDTVSRFEFPGADKIAHLFVYAILGLLILRGWHREKMPPLDLHAFVFALCVVFGFTVELHQGLTAYRSFEAGDLVADAAGALLGLVAWHVMMLRWGRRTRLYPGLLRPELKSHPSQRKRRT